MCAFLWTGMCLRTSYNQKQQDEIVQTERMGGGRGLVRLWSTEARPSSPAGRFFNIESELIQLRLSAKRSPKFECIQQSGVDNSRSTCNRSLR